MRSLRRKRFPPTESLTENPKNFEIEALRGIAILLVLIAHFTMVTPWIHYETYARLTTIYEFGVGVDLFFVISGFVVSMSLLGRGKNNPLSRANLKSFFIKRAFRLLPAAWFWIVLTLLCSLFFNDYRQFGNVTQNFQEAFFLLTLTYDFYIYYLQPNPHVINERIIIFGHYWSLTLEQQFYLLLPCIVGITPKRALKAILIGLVLVAWAIGTSPYRPTQNAFRLDGFLVGVLLFLATQSNKAFLQKIAPTNLSEGSRMLVHGILIYLLVWGTNHLPPGFGQIMATLSSLVMVWLASYQKNFGIASPVLVWLGSRSYAIYITHLLIYRANAELWNNLVRLPMPRLQVDLETMNPLPVIATAFILTLVATEFTHRVLEKPAIAFGHRLANTMKERKKPA